MAKQQTCPYSGKRKLTKDRAKRLSRYLRGQKGNHHMSAYWCGCDSWHVGHTPGVLLRRNLGRKQSRREATGG